MTNVKLTVAFLSTCVYPVGLNKKLTEEDLHSGNPHPSNYGYAFAKRQHEVLCRLYNERQFQNKHYCLIPPNIYGKNDNFNPVNSHVIPGIIEKMNKNISDLNLLDAPAPETLVLPGSGQSFRQFAYNEDIARQTIQFVKLLLDTPRRESIPTVLNIGNESSYQISEVAKIIYDQFKNRHKFEVNYKFEKKTYHPSYDGVLEKHSDLTKWKSLFGEPKSIDLEEGLRRTVDWFLLNGK